MKRSAAYMQQQASEKPGKGGLRRVPGSRAGGSLPSLIAVGFARPYDGERGGHACCRVRRSLPLPYARPWFDPSGRWRPLGDLARSVMQITTHLPGCPRCLSCVCFMCVSRCRRNNNSQIGTDFRVVNEGSCKQPPADQQPQ